MKQRIKKDLIEEIKRRLSKLEAAVFAVKVGS